MTIEVALVAIREITNGIWAILCICLVVRLGWWLIEQARAQHAKCPTSWTQTVHMLRQDVAVRLALGSIAIAGGDALRAGAIWNFIYEYKSFDAEMSPKMTVFSGVMILLGVMLATVGTSCYLRTWSDRSWIWVTSAAIIIPVAIHFGWR